MNDLRRLDHWDVDRAAICARLAKSPAGDAPALLTLVLKTKDERRNLEPWLAHHAGIVGYDNIIIMDNDSSDAAVLETYRAAPPALTVVRFSGYFDLIHSPRFFPELYEALRERTRFFLFLDTDEYLAYIDARPRYAADHNVTGFLARHADCDIFPCASFTNIVGYESRFQFGDPATELTAAVAWGKPVLSTALIPRLHDEDVLQHNCQIPLDCYGPRTLTNLVLLHRSQVTVEQRITSNLRKLAAYGDVADADPQNVFAVDPGDLTIGREYVLETRRFLEAEASSTDDRPGFEIVSDGLLLADTPAGEATLKDYFRHPFRAPEGFAFPGLPRIATEALAPPSPSDTDDSAIMIDEAILYGRRVFLYGWAFGPPLDLRVQLFSNDRHLADARLNSRRPDVAAAYRRPLDERNGYAAWWWLSDQDLEQAETVITAQLVTASGSLLNVATRTFRASTG